MRDLKIDEMAHVYGAGGGSRNDCYSSCKGKSKKKKSSRRKRKSSKRKYC